MWELVRTGWGGLAKPASGIERIRFCEVCRSVRYSGIKDASQLIDENKWDGSDFFMVWPMPTHVFVTDRVVQLIRKEKLSGAVMIASQDLPTTDGYSPGRLSYWMPEARARALGKTAGIAEV